MSTPKVIKKDPSVARMLEVIEAHAQNLGYPERMKSSEIQRMVRLIRTKLGL